MSRVFVVQRPSFKDATGRWADKYDLTPARHYGRLVEVLPRGNVPQELSVTVEALRRALSDFADDDYLLTVGDPVAIALAAVVATESERATRLRLLKWDRRAQQYLPYTLALDG